MRFTCYLFTDLFGTKGQLDHFRFFLWQQHKATVAWSGCDKIVCQNKDGM